MQTVIIVVHLMIVSVLIGAVLLQKSEGGGLGMGGGAGFMSSRGTANLLSRTTAVTRCPRRAASDTTGARQWAPRFFRRMEFMACRTRKHRS